MKCGGMAAFFRYFASLDLPMRVIEDSAGRRVEAHRRPLGVIGAILPWNYPLCSSGAQAAGRACRRQYAGAEARADDAARQPAFRRADCRCAAGGRDQFHRRRQRSRRRDDASSRLRKISFTGSTATGRRSWRVWRRRLKRITLELGGNDAGDRARRCRSREAVAKGIFSGAFENSGQVCLAIKRLYVHEFDLRLRCATNCASSPTPRSSMMVRNKAPSSGRCRTACSIEKVKGFLEDARRTATSSPAARSSIGPGSSSAPTIVRDITEGTVWSMKNSSAPSCRS